MVYEVIWRQVGGAEPGEAAGPRQGREKTSVTQLGGVSQDMENTVGVLGRGGWKVLERRGREACCSRDR